MTAKTRTLKLGPKDAAIIFRFEKEGIRDEIHFPSQRGRAIAHKTSMRAAEAITALHTPQIMTLVEARMVEIKAK